MNKMQISRIECETQVEIHGVYSFSRCAMNAFGNIFEWFGKGLVKY